MISRRAVLGGAFALSVPRSSLAWTHGNPAGSPSWITIPVGGGGYQSKLSISPSGVILSGTDAGSGCHLGSTVLGTANVCLQTGSSLPASFLPSPYIGGDSYDLTIGPSGTFWWYWSTTVIGTLLKSTNQGTNWTTTGFPVTSANGNGNQHPVIRQMIAEDPNNPNVIYVGGYDALRRSLDGGATFTTVSGITAPGSDPGVCGIQFDPTSGTTTLSGQTVTARILVNVFGTGVYQSSNGGSTFSLISGSPTAVYSSCMGSDGWYYACQYGSTNLIRISPTNALSTITCGTAFGMMVVNPNNPAQGIAWDSIGGGCITFNGAINGGTPPTATHNGSSVTVTATDAPWLTLTGNPSLGPIDWDPFLTTSATSLTIGTGSQTLTVATGQNIAVGDPIRVSNTGTLTNYMRGTVTAYNSSTGSLTFTVGNNDTGQYLGAQTGGSGTFGAWRVTKDRVWYCCGVGLIRADAPSVSGTNAYTTQVFGIETLSSCAVLWPPGRDPILISSDFPFRTQAVNPVGQTTGNSSYQPSVDYGGITDGNTVAYAVSDPTTLFAITPGKALTSTNQGLTWSALSSVPSAASPVGCWIAASTDTNIVVAAGSAMNYTTNGGTSWSNSSGQPTIAHGPFGLAGSPICADSVTAGTFYCVSNTAVYVSTNSGATWTATGGTVQVGTPNLVAVPGNAGHLLYASGQLTGSGATPAAIVASSPNAGGGLSFSSNGGVTWTTLPNTQEAISVACGAAKPGGNGYPAFAFAGWVSGVYGLWRVDNFNPSNISATTYTNIGTYPNNTIDFPDSFAGDSLNWNWWILSQRGSGWRFYGVGGSWP